MKTMLKTLVIGLAFALASCTKDDATPVITAEEASVNAKIDLANNDVTDIVMNEEQSTYLDPANKNSALSTLALPPCATISRVPAFGTPLTPGTQVTKTIDFGTAGCTLASGNVVKGRIIISFTFNPGATSNIINYQFDNFYHNNLKFDGNKTFTRVMTPATATTPSLPVVTMNMDMSVTLPNGNVYQRVGQRVRQITAGYDTPNVLTDNVYSVTGSWTTTFPSSTLQTSTITTPLMVKMSCISTNKPLLVSGVITIERNGNTATLDYGDGTCDNTALFTFNGTSVTIVIGN